MQFFGKFFFNLVERGIVGLVGHLHSISQFTAVSVAHVGMV